MVLEQQLIVTYSIKYRNYLSSIRNRQVERAWKAVENGANAVKKKRQNDPKRFIKAESIVKINQHRWEIEEYFRIMKFEFQARPVYLK